MRSLRHFLWLFILVIAASVPGQRGDAGGLELVVQTGHPYGVSAIAFTSDSRLAASGDNDGTVKLWDMATRRELRVFKGHTRFLTEIVFSNDGKLLATVQSGDPLLILWEVETGRKRLETLLGSGTVVFSDSDRFLVNKNEIWDTETGELPDFLGKRGPAEEADIGPIAISQDGRTLAIANEVRGIRLFDLVTERELRIFEGNTGATSYLTFSPDGSILVSAGEDRKAVFWNVSDGGRSGAPVDLAAAAYSMVFSPTGEFLVIGDIVLDVAARSTVMRLADRTGRDPPVFSPDGGTLVLVDWQQRISIWDLESGTERATSLNTKNLSGISRPVFSPDGKFLIFRNALWDVSEGRDANILGERGDFDAVAFSADGKTLALARRVDLEPRKVASAELRSDIEIWDLGSERELAPLRGRAVAVSDVSLSPDGSFLAAGDTGGALKLWDLNNVGESVFLNNEGDFIGDFVFSPDGNLLATHQMTGSGYRVKLWDLDTGRAAGEFEAGSGTGRLRFSSTGRFLSYGNSAWDLKSLSRVELGPLGEFDQVEFSFDETRIAILEVGGDDLTQQSLTVRNVVSGVGIQMESAEGSVSAPLAFSPDGRYLAASGGGYPYLIVWDTNSGKVHSVIEDDYDRLNAWPAESIRFSPDGRTVAADRGESNPIGLWDTETGASIGYDKLPAWVRFSGSFAVSRINGRMVRAVSDGAGIDVRDADSNETLALIVAVETSDWAVTTRGGLFDASAGGREMMHFVLGLEPISLEQMKDVYYVPGLLQKIFKGEPLPKVGLFTSKDLYPEAAFEFDEQSRELS
ncbi:MAG: PD40 domain-containing protein, partial [Aridibacter famidurans]|nr:PD40 domain-containing protein [Aridibacter famidurans]